MLQTHLEALWIVFLVLAQYLISYLYWNWVSIEWQIGNFCVAWHLQHVEHYVSAEVCCRNELACLLQLKQEACWVCCRDYSWKSSTVSDCRTDLKVECELLTIWRKKEKKVCWNKTHRVRCIVKHALRCNNYSTWYKWKEMFLDWHYTHAFLKLMLILLSVDIFNLMYLLTCLMIFSLSVCPPACVFIIPPTKPTTHPPTDRPNKRLSVFVSVYLFIHCICLSVCLCVYLSICSSTVSMRLRSITNLYISI